ncbi:MAG: ABC transporter ATP-binding protein [Candidatus Bathyarchaeia archaeon]
MPEVKLVNVTKRYGRIVANDRINIIVKDKEYVTLLGPSGCGKTTLIKCIAGIIRPDEGEVYIDGELVNDVPMEDRGIGYVFQNIALFPHMDVWGNVTYGPRIRGQPIEEIRPLAIEMLEMIRLSVRSDAYSSELSGGMQQKTALARALTSRAALLLLDEPLGALDAKVRAELRHELRRLVKGLGLTAIHVTHDQEEAMSISDRIILMKAGRIVEVGTPMSLYIEPRHIFTANFVGEANFFEGKIVHVDEEGCTVGIGDGMRLTTTKGGFRRGDSVVVAFRPEFASLDKDGSVGLNRLPGHITEITLSGGFNRILVKLRSGDTAVVKTSSGLVELQLGVDEDVMLSISPENILVYPYPETGLDKELALE